MREIVLVRHAAASGQQAEAPLTAEGRQQASALADVLLSLGSQRLIASPFRRAIESVEPFARRSGLTIETDQRLVERVLSVRGLPDWRSVVVTHGNLLALILRWVDEKVGYEHWAQLSNPDVFVVQLDGVQRSFRRAWA